MASAAFSSWVRAGRPVTPCRPILDIVTVLRATYPAAARAGCFGWHADDTHYEAVPPEDHTPFSATDWPIDCPRFIVFASDFMPHSSYDLDVVTGYWLTEARAGRFPSLKYLIRKDKIYTTWRGWVADPYRGAYHGHTHASFRTDFETTSLGAWSPLPGGTDDDMTPEQALELHYVHEATKYELRNWTAQSLQALGRIEPAVAALTTVIKTLAAAIVAGGGSVDTAAILAGVDERLAGLAAETRDAVADLGEGGAEQVRADADAG